MGQPRGGDPRHLRRGVGAQTHHALAVRVHQPERLLGHRGAGAGQQAVLEFQQRRLDALVAVRGEHIHQRLDRRGLGLGIGRQQVAQAGGQQGPIVGRVVAHAAIQLSAIAVVWNAVRRETLRIGGLRVQPARRQHRPLWQTVEPQRSRRLPLVMPTARTSRRHTMLFNSPEFILGFLPICARRVLPAGRAGGPRWALRWLVAASLFFYGWWNPRFVLLLAGSILAQLRDRPAHPAPGTRRSAARRTPLADRRHRRQPGAAGLVQIRQLPVCTACSRLHAPELHIFLPLAISFFTFQQIMFLVESYRGDRVDAGLLPYAAFVAFFPHLIAGPIVRPREIMPQLLAADLAVPRADTSGRGHD